MMKTVLIKAGNLFEKTYKYVVVLISVSVLTLITFYNARMTSFLVKWEVTYYVKDSFLLNFLIVVLFTALFVVFRKSRFYHRLLKVVANDTSFRKLKNFILVMIFALSACWALATQFVPGVDEGEIQGYVYDFIQKDYHMFAPSGDMYRYPSNRGLFLFVYVVSLLFGGHNYLIFELINAFAVAMIFKQLSEIGTAFGLGRIAQLSIVLCGIVFFPVALYSIMVYGNMMGVALALTAVKYELRFFSGYEWKSALWCAIFISLALLIKTTIAIYFIAICIFAFVKLVKEKRAVILLLIVFLICGFAIQSTVPTLYLEHVTGYKMDNPCSSWAFVAMGLQDGDLAPGWWTGYIQTSYAESGGNTEIQAELAKSNIRESVSAFIDDPGYAFSFFTKKIASTWANPSFQCFGTVRKGSNIYPSRLIYGLLSYNGQHIAGLFLNIIVILILAGSLLGLILNYRKDNYVDSLILPMIVVGGFGFLLFWETKARYALLFFVVLIPYAAMGYESLIKVLSEPRDKRMTSAAAPRKISAVIRRYLFPVIICVSGFLVCTFAYAGDNEQILMQDTDAYYEYLANQRAETSIPDGTYCLGVGNKAVALTDATNAYGRELLLVDKTIVSDRSENAIYIATYQGTTRMMFEETRMYVSDFISGDGTHVLVAALSNQADSQKWSVRKLDDGTYAILSHSGYALTYDFFDGRVYLRSYTGALNQKWQVRKYDIANNGAESVPTHNFEELYVSELHSITDIDKYLDCLFVHDEYSAYFSVKDIQGYSLSEETIEKLERLGFDQARILLEHEYHNFIGIFNGDAVVHQYVGGDESSVFEGNVDGNSILIESATLNHGNQSSIVINGIDYSTKYRGINIVVIDNNTGKVVDSVAFDTHLDDIPCVR